MFFIGQRPRRGRWPMHSTLGNFLLLLLLLLLFWAAVPKGMMSYRTQRNFVHSFIYPFAPPGPLKPEICPLRPEICFLRPWICPLRPEICSQTNKSPLCSTGHCPLLGHCPASSHSNSQPWKVGQWVSLTTNCPWGTGSIYPLRSSNPSLEAQIPASGLIFQPWGSNPSLESQNPVPRLNSKIA